MTNQLHPLTKAYYSAGSNTALIKLGLEELPDMPEEYEDIFKNPNINQATKLELLRDIREQQAQHPIAPESDYKNTFRKRHSAIGAAGGGGLGVLLSKGLGAKGRALSGLGGALAGAGLGYATGGPTGEFAHGADLAEQERAFEQLENPIMADRQLAQYVAEAQRRQMEEEKRRHKQLVSAIRDHHSAYNP